MLHLKIEPEARSVKGFFLPLRAFSIYFTWPFRIACSLEEIRIFRMNPFGFEQSDYFWHWTKELIVIIQTDIPDLSASQSELRRVDCFSQVFERLPFVEDFGLRRCISRIEPVDLILQKWESKMSAFRWWGSQLYSLEECKCRTIQRNTADPSIWRGQTLHVRNLTFPG
jgi:hypothetical protein